MNRILPVFGSAALLACATDVNLGQLAGDDGDSSGTTGPSTEGCGDGVVQLDEACDNAGDDADGCLSTCELATSCRQILALAPGAADGVYAIDPDGVEPNPSFSVYCDMTNDGGGWTLLAKIHRWHQPPNYDEPLGWLAQARDLSALLDTVSYEDRPAASASHGEARMDPMIAGVELARFTVIAEDDVMQRATWFKEVEPDIWAWFTREEHAPTLVCSNLELTRNCAPGDIRSDGDVTFMDGMLLSHHGYMIDGGNVPISVRLNGDFNEYTSGVCSCTVDYQDNAWHDDAIFHWGNGLEIWLR